jgi:chorismate mutase
MHLDAIAAVLESLEETIINKLIDRAQFRANSIAYQTGKSGFDGEPKASLFDLRLKFHEIMDAQFGRFLVPEERPFSDGLPGARRSVSVDKSFLSIDDYNKANVNEQIIKKYLSLVPVICAGGDDGQYGSSVEHDVFALQAISRRVHYGALYVGERKFRDNREELQELIQKRDIPSLEKKLTRAAVEEKILSRVTTKVNHLQKDVDKNLRVIVDERIVRNFYADCIIPLTKQGEIFYLLNRRR